MNSEIIISKLTDRLSGTLPGISAQARMSSLKRITRWRRSKPENPLKSSVLILLYPYQEEMSFVLIQRSDYNGVHSSQISLPGGKFENSDPDLWGTAIRETQEEIGILSSTIHFLGKLTPLYIPPSNYMVNPFIGFTKSRPDFIPEHKEVAEIIEVRLSDLMNEQNVKTRRIKIKLGFSFRVPCWEINGHIVWGATAMILAEFHELIKSAGILISGIGSKTE